MKIRIAVVLSLLCIGGIAWAQLPIADYFSEENKGRVEKRKSLEEEARKFHKEDGVTVDKIIIADDAPGSTGLKLVGESRGNFAKLPVAKLSYSVLKSPMKDGNPMTSSVFTQSGVEQTTYDFSSYLASDPGYIADPFWMRDDEVLIVKSGRYDYYGFYYLYAFDKKNRRLFRVLPQSLVNRKITVSPSRRFLTYVVGGGIYGKDGTNLGTRELSLWVWDASTNKSTKVSENDWLQGSYSWRSDQTLSYSVLEKRNGRMVAVSYLWNATSHKSSEELVDAYNVVPSPNGRFIIYATSINKKENFSLQNSHYEIRDLLSQESNSLKVEELGAFSLNRQVIWSLDSKSVYSVLNKPTQAGHRIFNYNIADKKSTLHPVAKADDRIELLTPPSGSKELIVLRESIGEVNSLREFDLNYSIFAFDLQKGKETSLFKKEKVLGLSSNSISLEG